MGTGIHAAGLRWCQLGPLRLVGRAHKKKMAGSLRTPPFLLEDQYVRDKVTRTATESELQPSETAARVTFSLRAYLHDPWAAETRPNQRVNVPLDHLLQLLRATRRRLPPT